MPQQDDLFGGPSGRELAEEGIRKSVEHAEDVVPEWRERAFDWVQKYAQWHRSLTIEDVKALAYERGLERPPAEGAWGAITIRARKAGIIRFDTYRESANASQHMKPVRVWHSLVYRGLDL